MSTVADSASIKLCSTKESPPDISTNTDDDTFYFDENDRTITFGSALVVMNRKNIPADWFIVGIKDSISVEYVVNVQQDRKVQTRITKQNTVNDVDEKKYCFDVSRNIRFDKNDLEDSNLDLIVHPSKDEEYNPDCDKNIEPNFASYSGQILGEWKELLLKELVCDKYVFTKCTTNRAFTSNKASIEVHTHSKSFHTGNKIMVNVLG